MRICRLAWFFPRSNELTYGLGPNFYYISREQAKLGQDVHVISPAPPDAPPFEEIDGVKVHRVKFPYNLNAMRKLFALHRETKLGLVHAHGTCGLTYPLLRAQMKRPLVVHVHGTTLESQKRYFGMRSDLQRSHDWSYQESLTLLRQKYFWSRADLLIAVSGAVRRELADLYHIKQSKIAVVYNGISPEVFRHVDDGSVLRDELGIENTKRIILYVGHFGPRKGLPVILEAMSLVLRRIPNALLLAVGGVPKWLGSGNSWKDLEEAIRSKGIGASVRLLGQIQHNVLPSFYSLADVFVMPSYYEAFPKVVLEAMACEAPVVATRTGGIPEIVDEGVNGLLFEPGNATDLADKIIDLLKDSTSAQKMGVEGRRRVMASFTWEQTAKNILKAYQMVA